MKRPETRDASPERLSEVELQADRQEVDVVAVEVEALPFRTRSELRAELPRCSNPEHEVGAVVVVRDKRMAEAWHLATSFRAKTAAATIKLYGRRFTIEETFRDQKDLRFGMGLRATHIRSAARRDRLLMLLAIAQALLSSMTMSR